MKNIIYILLSIFSLFYYTDVFSQTDNLCGADAIHKYLILHDSAYAAKVNTANDFWRQYQSNKGNSRILSDTVITIPIVVHIIHTNNANGIIDNPSDAQIIDKITELNKVYSATNPNYSTTSNGGVDVKIQFALAKRTPTCGATNGILRVYAGNLPRYVAEGIRLGWSDSGCGISTGEMMGLSPAWPENQYYNLYLVRDICNGPVGFAAFGSYAVCLVNGSIPTLVHETGHYLYLYHTFEESTDSTCASLTDCENTGDLVCDTDPLKTSGVNACSATDINPCTGRPYGIVANNFLSYGSCRTKLTPGQKTRMRALLEGPNREIIYSLGAQAPATVVPTLTISQYSGSNPSCSDSTIKFKATYSNNLGYAPLLRWFKNDGYELARNVDTLVSYSGSFSINDNDTIYCSILSTNQCMLPNPKISNKIVVHRYPRVTPNILISLVTGLALSCENTPLTFKATSTYGGTNPAFQWRINNTNVGTNSTNFTSSAIQNNDHITCVLTSNENCTSKTKDTSNSITINRMIYATPTVSISITTNNGSAKICQGVSISFLATAGNYFQPPTFQWKVNGINVAATTNYFTTNTLNNNDIVTCEITAKDSCVTIRKVTSNAIKITVMPKVVPTLVIQNLTNNDSACAGEFVKLKAIPTNSGMATYLWYLTYNSTKDTITDLISIGSKTYYCSIMIDTSRYCSNTPIVSATHKIYGEIKPAKPVITQISNYLKSNIATGNQWYSVTAGKITGAVNQTYYPTANGKYYCIVTKNRCSSPSSDTIIVNNITTGIFNNKNDNELAFQIIPNPNSGSFRIVTEDKISGTIEIFVYDVLGQEVFSKQFNHLHDKEISIQLPDIANGLYNVAIQKDNKAYPGKIEIIK